MREIKFRYWNTKSKKFDTEIGVYLIGGVDLANTIPEDYEITEFTGLKDKNGKEIWEGDLLLPNYNKFRAFEVKFEDGKYNCTGFNLKNCEVIGNIYENKELLK